MAELLGISIGTMFYTKKRIFKIGYANKKSIFLGCAHLLTAVRITKY